MISSPIYRNMAKVLFIINPIAGINRRRNFRNIISKCTHDWSIVETQYAGHARKLAEEADCDIVVAVGGDGTVNEVASGLVGTKKALGIIPCGSGNGLARHIKISMNPSEALETINRAHIEKIDTGVVNELPFFCTCGVGLDATVSERFAQAGKRGVQTYITEAFKVWNDYHPASYEVSIDGHLISQKAVLVTVANANQWGNNGFIAPHARLQDGLLNVTIVAPFNSFQIPGLVVSLLAGQINKMHGVYSYAGTDIRIIPEHSGLAHRDGEAMEGVDQLHATIRPASLRVVVPQNK